MNIALFTDWINASLLKSVFARYKGRISILHVVEQPKSNQCCEGVYLFDIRNDFDYEFLMKYNIDCVIVYGWNHRIPAQIVSKIPFYNIHPSLLPKYRGPIPVIFQLLNDERKSGVTLHKMDAEFDCGEIYKQKAFDVSLDESVESLNLKITYSAIQLIGKFLSDLINGDIELYPQDENEASYFSYKDLKFYIVDHNICFYDFERRFKILNGRYPVMARNCNRIVEIKAYSKVEMEGMNQYELTDKTIFVDILNEEGT